MQPLSLDLLDSVLAAPAALVYKHSTRCPISAMAWDVSHFGIRARAVEERLSVVEAE